MRVFLSFGFTEEMDVCDMKCQIKLLFVSLVRLGGSKGPEIDNNHDVSEDEDEHWLTSITLSNLILGRALALADIFQKDRYIEYQRHSRSSSSIGRRGFYTTEYKARVRLLTKNK